MTDDRLRQIEERARHAAELYGSVAVLVAQDVDGLLARLSEVEAALRVIVEYEPTEVLYDEFAYKRMVESYRDAARAAQPDEDAL